MMRTEDSHHANETWRRWVAPALLLSAVLPGCGSRDAEPDESTDTTELAGAVSGHIYQVERCIGCEDHDVSLSLGFRNETDNSLRTTVVVTLTLGHVEHGLMYVRRVNFDYYLWMGDGARGVMYFWDDAQGHHFTEHNGFLDVSRPLHKTYAYEGVYSVTPSGTWTQEINQWVHGEDDDPARFWLENNVIESLDTMGGSGSKVSMLFEVLDHTFDKGGGSSPDGSGSGGGSPPPPPPVPVDEGCGHALLGAGAVLHQGESVATCNGRVVLYHQADGNVVLLHDGTPRWHTGTYGLQSESLVMQGDGNLVLYAPGGIPLWASGSDGHGGAFAALQEDCNFVVYSAESVPLWASGSTCY